MGHRERVGFGVVLFALLIAQLSCGDSSGPGLVASSFTANSATTQTASPGTEVAEPPSVIVRDQNGAMMTGVSVTFAVTAGGGSVTGGTAVSSGSGVATVGSWTVGTAEGVNTLTASSGTLGNLYREQCRPLRHRCDAFDWRYDQRRADGIGLQVSRRKLRRLDWHCADRGGHIHVQPVVVEI